MAKSIKSAEISILPTINQNYQPEEFFPEICFKNFPQNAQKTILSSFDKFPQHPKVSNSMSNEKSFKTFSFQCVVSNISSQWLFSALWLCAKNANTGCIQ